MAGRYQLFGSIQNCTILKKKKYYTEGEKEYGFQNTIGKKISGWPIISVNYYYPMRRVVNGSEVMQN